MWDKLGVGILEEFVQAGIQPELSTTDYDWAWIGSDPAHLASNRRWQKNNKDLANTQRNVSRKLRTPEQILACTRRDNETRRLNATRKAAACPVPPCI